MCSAEVGCHSADEERSSTGSCNKEESFIVRMAMAPLTGLTVIYEVKQLLVSERCQGVLSKGPGVPECDFDLGMDLSDFKRTRSCTPGF